MKPNDPAYHECILCLYRRMKPGFIPICVYQRKDIDIRTLDSCPKGKWSR